MLDDLVAGEQAPLVEHEILQDRVLLGCQLHLLVANVQLPAAGVERDRPRGQHGRPIEKMSPRKCSDPGHHLTQREGLHQVVVGTRLQAQHAVVERVAGGQHQDRDAHALTPETAADLEAIDSWQHQVEQDDVIRDRLGSDERFLAVIDGVRGDAGVFESASNAAGQAMIVFHDQDSHRPSPRARLIGLSLRTLVRRQLEALAQRHGQDRGQGQLRQQSGLQRVVDVRLAGPHRRRGRVVRPEFVTPAATLTVDEVPGRIVPTAAVPVLVDGL